MNFFRTPTPPLQPFIPFAPPRHLNISISYPQPEPLLAPPYLIALRPVPVLSATLRVDLSSIFTSALAKNAEWMCNSRPTFYIPRPPIFDCTTWRIKNQLDATYYFIVLLVGWTCFGHYYAHHQELATMMLITTLVASFLVCCMLEVRCG